MRLVGPVFFFYDGIHGRLAQLGERLVYTQ